MGPGLESAVKSKNQCASKYSSGVQKSVSAAERKVPSGMWW